MKKFILPLLFIGIVFAGCKKEDPVIKGTMSLSPREVSLKFGEKQVIKQTFSNEGIAKDQKYRWSVSDGNVLELKTTTVGNNAEVTAKRIGTAWVRFISENGAFKDSVKITVDYRQLFRKIFYTKGASMQEIIAEEGVEPDSTKNNNSYLYFSRSKDFTQVIYKLDNNKLVETYAVVQDNAANENKLVEYIEERFQEIDLGAPDIKYFDASVPPVSMYQANTIIGIFKNNSNLITGETLPLGIIIKSK